MQTLAAALCSGLKRRAANLDQHCHHFQEK